MPIYPGDPLTPGVGATKDAKRPPFKEAATLTKIPVLPISYADAQPLLQGARRPGGAGGLARRAAAHLPPRSRPGPRPPEARSSTGSSRTTYNVIATLKGSELPDQWVVRGNHHDAWVNGATDPVSGMVALMEEARAIGELAQGRLEAAAHDRVRGLGRRGAGAARLDRVGRGPRRRSSPPRPSPTSTPTATAAASSTSAARTASSGSSTRSRRSSRIRPRAARSAIALIASAILSGTPEQRTALRDSRLFEIDALGSGSDYTPFLQHLGIASLNIGFGGEGDYGQYHSIYDSFDHYERFMDPDFAYGVALAKVGGRTVLRLADADLLPFEFTRAAGRIKTYVADVQKLADTLRTETTEHNRRIEDGVFTLAANPSEKVATPKRREPVPAFDFAPLTNAVERLTVAARRYDAKAGAAVAAGAAGASIAAANGVLLTAERALTRKDGLPRRPWFRHQIYAPGFYTGYGVKTLPAVREAIEERDFAEATAQIPKVAATIEAYAAEIEKAAASLEK